MVIMTYTAFIIPQTNKALVPHMYNPSIGSNYLPTIYSAGSHFCPPDSSCNPVSGQSVIMNAIPLGNQFPLIANSSIFHLYNTSHQLFYSRGKQAASRIGAFTISEIIQRPSDSMITGVGYFLHANYTARHAAPLYQTLFAQGVLRSIDPSASLAASIHPLPYTNFEASTYNSRQVDLIATFILLAIPYIAASFATFIVREREVKAKHQQFVSGVSVGAYWLGNLIWDVVSFYCVGI